MCKKQTKLNMAILLAVVLAMGSSVALANLPPIADAGVEEQTMYLGETVMLQGSATDPDGDPIFDWEWEVISAPANSNWSLANADTPNAIFNTDMIGNYVVTLIASDGLLWSDPDATVVIVIENQPPVAIIEATPISGPAPLVVSFDGTDSYDPEGEALGYDWNFGDLTFGTGATIDHEFQWVGIYEVVLKVTDEFGNIDFDSIEITVTEGSNIQVSPEAYDFGDVELTTSSSTIITITNPGGTGDPLELSDISFAEGSSGDFAITDYPETSTVLPGESVDVGITFTPIAEGYVSAVLQIASDDDINPLIEVALGGVGVYEELPPEGQIAAILAFFDASVEAGTLTGDGPGNSADNRRNALRNMIEASGDLIEDGLYEDACRQLAVVLKKCDGQPSPPDFVAGEAVEVLKGMIEVLRTTLGC
jgi:PKD repeat protein